MVQRHALTTAAAKRLIVQAGGKSVRADAILAIQDMTTEIIRKQAVAASNDGESRITAAAVRNLETRLDEGIIRDRTDHFDVTQLSLNGVLRVARETAQVASDAHELFRRIVMIVLMNQLRSMVQLSRRDGKRSTVLLRDVHGVAPVCRNYIELEMERAEHWPLPAAKVARPRRRRPAGVGHPEMPDIDRMDGDTTDEFDDDGEDELRRQSELYWQREELKENLRNDIANEERKHNSPPSPFKKDDLRRKRKNQSIDSGPPPRPFTGSIDSGTPRPFTGPSDTPKKKRTPQQQLKVKDQRHQKLQRAKERRKQQAADANRARQIQVAAARKRGDRSTKKKRPDMDEKHNEGPDDTHFEDLDDLGDLSDSHLAGNLPRTKQRARKGFDSSLFGNRKRSKTAPSQFKRKAKSTPKGKFKMQRLNPSSVNQDQLADLEDDLGFNDPDELDRQIREIEKRKKRK